MNCLNGRFVKNCKEYRLEVIKFKEKRWVIFLKYQTSEINSKISKY